MDNGESSYRRYLSGDTEAFDEIVSTYRAELMLFINSIIHDMASAEDIAIDVFMQLVIHRRRYNFKTSLRTYLYMMARSRSIDFLRRRKRLKEDSLSQIEIEPEDIVSLESTVIDSERKRIVRDAIERLPEQMKTAVYLVYFSGLSYEDAASVMKKNKKQVDNLLYRAKSELREILGNEGKELI